MPIPKFKAAMLPMLQYLSDGKERSNQEIYDALEEKFNLSEEEKDQLLPSGRQRVIVNRFAWAKSYLKQAGLLERVRRGCYRITEEGINVVTVQKPDKIDIDFLNQFSEFVKSSYGKGNDGQDVTEEDKDDVEKTPQEYIESGYNAIMKDVSQELLSNINNCSFRFFEQLVIDLLLAMGYGGSRREAGRLTKRGSDEGIDGIINEDKLGLDVIYVQAKRWEGSVGRPVVQAFAGSLEGYRAKRGIMITTSNYTKEAVEYVQKIEKRIVLIDGDRLGELMLDYSVGVSTVAHYDVMKIDTDYFIED